MIRKQLVTIITLNAFYLIAGNYTSMVTDQTGCSYSVNIVVNQPSPLAISTGADQSICEGNSAVLGGNPPASGGISPYANNCIAASFVTVSVDPLPSPGISQGGDTLFASASVSRKIQLILANLA